MTPRVIVGRYVVQRAVGHGGMGTVWLCRDEVLGRDVAVKQVGAMPGETVSDVNRALREARSSAGLNHRNVVSIFDAVEDGDHNWLVMEYVPSRTLAEILAAEGALPPERVAWIGAQAADGLAAAHGRGTVHRDVKPGNILVTDDDLVKIMDFGISRTHGDDQLTQSGLVTGTPGYFSPELARGEEPGLPADVWGLGATLYAAVEGHALYPERTNAIVLLTQIASQPAPPPTRAAFLTEPINRMLDRDPTTRWSMDDVAHSLHRLHERHPVAAPRHDTAPFTPLATPVAAPVAAAASAPAEPTHTRERPVPAPVEDRHRRSWLLPSSALLVLLLVGAGGYGLLSRGTSTSDQGGAATSPAHNGSHHPRTAATSTSPAPPPTDSTSPTVAATTDAAGFVQDYYRLLPTDTTDAWQLLSPTYHATTTYGDYQGFWRTVNAVSVDSAVVSGATSVDVSLTYTHPDGTTESETRRIFLEQSGTGYLIDHDSLI